ncbi:MAG: hypothetical protein HQL65_04900 [Magnetococcales bacterium]|nr:hypothetical protein [Magnetococcales bacterium]
MEAFEKIVGLVGHYNPLIRVILIVTIVMICVSILSLIFFYDEASIDSNLLITESQKKFIKEWKIINKNSDYIMDSVIMQVQLTKGDNIIYANFNIFYSIIAMKDFGEDDGMFTEEFHSEESKAVISYLAGSEKEDFQSPVSHKSQHQIKYSVKFGIKKGEKRSFVTRARYRYDYPFVDHRSGHGLFQDVRSNQIDFFYPTGQDVIRSLTIMVMSEDFRFLQPESTDGALSNESGRKNIIPILRSGNSDGAINNTLISQWSDVLPGYNAGLLVRIGD